ncbi:MAG: LCP family protein [Clostridia bacterium]|nr:LCP family protein [Clostridia bacterium]
MINSSLIKRIFAAALILAVMPVPSAFAETGGDIAPGSVTVNDLAVTPGLDESWVNILFLGVNSLEISASSRAGTMIICSVNKSTGAVKLTSLLGDTEAVIAGKGRRLSTAYAYGGAKLAVKAVNENFGMNITGYVVVDFTGFAHLVDKIGGIEADLTKEEAAAINRAVPDKSAALPENGGKKIHLNGAQTLAYARVSTGDGDLGRAGRQRNALNLLMAKLKTRGMLELLDLLFASMDVMQINLDVNTIMALGMRILLGEGLSGAGTFTLPVQGTYREEKSNDGTMLRGVDFDANRRALYSFIYR